MPSPRLVCALADDVVAEGLREIRERLRVPDGFAADVEEAAAVAATRRFSASGQRGDARDIPFVTIDPAGSTDLDQAYHAARTSRGYEVHYAIADVAAFVDLGGVIANEALERGVTLYAPDQRAPLYPTVLSEGAASLLPDGDRPAVVWTIEVGEDGTLGDARVQRSIIRSREQLSYDEAQSRIDSGAADPSLRLLREIGIARLAHEVRRGAVSLALPEQQLQRIDGGYRLEFRAMLAVEQWNAQISLLTGIAAAHIMQRGGVGLLRTLPPPSPGTVATLRRAAKALHISWPPEMSYADRVRTLDPAVRTEAALMHQAARLFRGAGYVAFERGVPEASEHSAIASLYAHVTAPLRRVGDRYANEVVVALCEGHEVADDVRQALDQLPGVLGRAQQRQSTLDRASLDFAETLTLRAQIGQVFDAAVVNLDNRRATIEIADPAIVAEIPPGGVRLGQAIRVRLSGVDEKAHALRFTREDARGNHSA